MKIAPKWALGLACVVLLTGCGSEDSPSEGTTKSQPIDVVESEQPEDSRAEAVAINDDAVSGGITITVTGISETPSVTYEGGIQSDVTPNGTKRTVKAETGATYVTVSTKIANETKGPIDLTCGWPIDASVLNSDGQRFTPIDGLSQVKGNPECNDQLQPGFRDEMKWIFLTPADDEIVEFEFSDVSDLNQTHPPAVVQL